ncbi:MAG: hypothetical protein ACK4U0_11285 [Mesorhizobium sp.]
MQDVGATKRQGSHGEAEKPADVVVPFTCPDGTQVLVTLRSKSVERSDRMVTDAKQCVRALAEAFECERTAAAERAPAGEMPVDAVFRSWAYDS